MAPSLGQSEANAASDATALRFLRIYRSLNGFPEAIHPDEIAGDNLAFFMRNLLHFMSSTVIPRFHDDNFESAQDPNMPPEAPRWSVLQPGPTQAPPAAGSVSC